LIPIARTGSRHMVTAHDTGDECRIHRAVRPHHHIDEEVIVFARTLNPCVIPEIDEVDAGLEVTLVEEGLSDARVEAAKEVAGAEVKPARISTRFAAHVCAVELRCAEAGLGEGFVSACADVLES